MLDEEKKLNEEENEEVTPATDEEIEQIEEGIVPGLSERELVSEVKQSFLDYAMSVIVSRAIPDVRDGLKPVHRRIIFGMNELGMLPNQAYRKCARIVGDVMGKYHPHGDSSIYSALVRLAQPFSIRYTLVDGHGNFGSIDGDEAAAMRYTEARMTKISLEMVRDIKKNTVDFIPNYDGEEEEPVVLPSRFPNLLVNGSNGIAVGMATNIPPHNLTEVINAIVAIARNPELTTDEIMANYLYGPDFPTGGIILGRAGIKKAYETGQGSLTIRSRAEIEEHGNDRKRIVITEIPYGVNKETECIDYDELERLALQYKPKLIVSGASSYSRIIDFKKIREICDKVGALMMVDMAHIAGLVAAGLHPSPIPYAHVVTTTTHKTLRGPRGGMILSSQEVADKYNFNKAIFPGIQGGPLMHVIAAKAVCFKEALQPEFKVYQQNIIDNAQALCKGLMDRGIKIVSGGTDNHLMLVDLTNYDLTGKAVEKLLDSVNITCNKNTIPNDPKSPFVTSGVRLGTPAVTSRGLNTADMDQIAEAIAMMIKEGEPAADKAKAIVKSLTEKYPLK